MHSNASFELKKRLNYLYSKVIQIETHGISLSFLFFCFVLYLRKRILSNFLTARGGEWSIIVNYWGNPMMVVHLLGTSTRTQLVKTVNVTLKWSIILISPKSSASAPRENSGKLSARFCVMIKAVNWECLPLSKSTEDTNTCMHLQARNFLAHFPRDKHSDFWQQLQSCCIQNGSLD